MKRYTILKNIYDFLQSMQIDYEYQNKMEKAGYEPVNEYVLFERKGVGHISIKMTNRGLYELVSYNEKTGVYCGVNGHTEEFIDSIMKGQTGV